jgi:hypothetical protein
MPKEHGTGSWIPLARLGIHHWRKKSGGLGKVGEEIRSLVRMKLGKLFVSDPRNAFI